MIRTAAFFLALGSVAAQACAVEEPFAVANIAAGPVVVVANVTGYARAGMQDGYLTLQVTDVLKGTAPGHLRVTWPVLMAEQPPGTWNRPYRIVAAITSDGQGYRLVVEICGRAWLAEASAENLAIIRGALP